MGAMVLGLNTRIYHRAWPAFIVTEANDALWGAMVYLIFRFLFPQKTRLFSFAGSIAFSFAIEFSQLSQAPWINILRKTTLGALILGMQFLWIDLVKYTIGISLVWMADTFILRRYKSLGSEVWF
jgi:hypothetical protein